MRQIGTLPDGEQAERFADFLRAQGTVCSIDRGEHGWAVWIHDEDRVPAARVELQTFSADPSQERYRHAHQQAAEKLRDDFARRKTARRQNVSLRQRWEQPVVERCPITVGLLLACVVVGFFTRLGGHFLLSSTERAIDFLPLQRELWISPDRTWNAILSGQIWRIWTPIFLHYGWLHIIFNSLVLKDFGMMLEDRLGTPRFLGLVLIVGAAGNLAQFAVTGLPYFGGMSGVNYGLFGYLWIRGKLDPESGLGVSPQNVTMMILWFVLCWTGLVGDIANWDHAAGLAAGIGLAAWASIKRR